jgi:hypothetical protein
MPLVGCNKSGGSKNKTTSEFSVSQGAKIAADSEAKEIFANEEAEGQSAEQTVSKITGSIESQNGVFLISREQFISQLDQALENDGVKALSDYDVLAGEKEGPNGEEYSTIRYRVEDVVLVLSTGKNDDKLTEVLLAGVSADQSEASKDIFAAYMVYCISLIDNAVIESIIHGLGAYKGEEITKKGENASYTFDRYKGMPVLLISPLH